jgi:hypothetical protein
VRVRAIAARRHALADARHADRARVALRIAPDALALRGALRSESRKGTRPRRKRMTRKKTCVSVALSWFSTCSTFGEGGSRPTRARGIRSRRSDPVALHARRGSCETKSATHLWTHVVRLAVPRVGPAFPAVRCVVPGFARDALPRETHVSAPKRAAADVTRPRGPLPRDARLIGTPRRDRRGRFLRGGPHRPRQARQPLREHDRQGYF